MMGMLRMMRRRRRRRGERVFVVAPVLRLTSMSSAKPSH